MTEGSGRSSRSRGLSLGGAVLVFVALFLLTIQVMKGSDSYAEAERFLFEHPEVTSRLGGELRSGHLPQGNCSSGSSGTHARFEIVLKGERGRGTGEVKLVKQDDRWSVSEAHLVLPGGSIDLLAPARSPGEGNRPRLAATADGRIAELRLRVAADPDSFEAARDLDYALAGLGRFEEILPIWETYLARHPDDARAWYERGGTWSRLGKVDRAMADCRRACELGLDRACARVEHFEAMFRRR